VLKSVLENNFLGYSEKRQILGVPSTRIEATSNKRRWCSLPTIDTAYPPPPPTMNFFYVVDICLSRPIVDCSNVQKSQDFPIFGVEEYRDRKPA